MEIDHYPPIRDLAAIGDGSSVALVDRAGEVVWLCLPRLDSPSAFASLLDAERGGRFWLRPAIPFDVERRYVPHTNVLETVFRTAAGVVRLTESINFGAMGSLPWNELARKVDGLSGRVPMEWGVHPRFDYGQAPARFEWRQGHPVTPFSQGTLAVLAYLPQKPEVSPERVRGRFEIAEGQSALLALIASEEAPTELPPREHVEARLQGSLERWRRWATGMRYSGEWQEEVERSALALALTGDARSGAIVAAPTCSLPEQIGGKRNWDYRYCWTRDLSFTLDALMALDFREHASQSLRWILDAVAGTEPEVKPIYKANGEVLHEKEELPLAGYRGSRPVYRGNRAATQLQLGSYGDLFATVEIYVSDGNLIAPRNGELLTRLANHVCESWRKKDSSIWELQESQHYTISKMGCWVALDRAIKLAKEGQIPPHGLKRWEAELYAIREFIETKCWSPEKRSYLQYAGGDTLDAGTLLAGRTGYTGESPERLAHTVEAISRELGRGPLLYRYSGMEKTEGAFLACSFWKVDALLRLEKLDEAALLMDALMKLANDVGLFSEEIDPDTGAFLGNFPQALTHLTLINAASQFQATRRKLTRGR